METAFSDKKFDGMTFEKRAVSGFSLKELNYSPNAEIPKHAHEQAIFCMAVKGGCTETYRRRTREFTPFSLSFLPAFQTHSLKASTRGMRAFSINVPLFQLERMREYSLNVEEYRFCASGILIELLTRLYREYQNMDDASPLVVEGIVLEMLAEISRRRVIDKIEPSPGWLKHAHEIVHEEFSLPLSLETIAREVGAHPVHLARMFRRFFGCSVGEYVRRVRIENACRRMVTTETPLIEIALACGFSDQSHFNRIFKRLKGMTPSRYRIEFGAR